MHVGVDAGSDLIRRLAFTPAHVNESSVADALICGDEKAVYADKGYESKKRRAALKARNIKERIMHRSQKNQAACRPGKQRATPDRAVGGRQSKPSSATSNVSMVVAGCATPTSFTTSPTSIAWLRSTICAERSAFARLKRSNGIAEPP